MASNELTADQARDRNLAAMGEELGSIYSQLWQELAWLHRTWAEYVALFGTKESRVDLLNEAAPAFNRIVQDSLWEGVILHVARLTDPPKSVGKRNLSIRALEDAATDSELKVQVSKAVAEALSASEFCRDWRNRHLAHRDLNLALKRGAEPLQAASRQKVKEALASLSHVLNVVSLKYMESTTLFDVDLRVGGGPGGAMSLLYYIDMGVEAERRRRERLKSGSFDESDYRPRDL
ncbi:hypothetical protein [Ramlibacter humi]|uniref:HEPN AbiU2-like domain-containing protein n=1 Tax=Ramlibacter humi TaxID=2530451 RepID=A0A4Z0CAF5_9BURK|nr:hypothetical protein [Ramlibacter humi]TFZ07872.1 hypothetical protein EZ216_01530 [Ramlibacter humi]